MAVNANFYPAALAIKGGFDIVNRNLVSTREGTDVCICSGQTDNCRRLAELPRRQRRIDQRRYAEVLSCKIMLPENAPPPGTGSMPDTI